MHTLKHWGNLTIRQTSLWCSNISAKILKTLLACNRFSVLGYYLFSFHGSFLLDRHFSFLSTVAAKYTFWTFRDSCKRTKLRLSIWRWLSQNDTPLPTHSWTAANVTYSFAIALHSVFLVFHHAHGILNISSLFPSMNYCTFDWQMWV